MYVFQNSKKKVEIFVGTRDLLAFTICDELLFPCETNRSNQIPQLYYFSPPSEKMLAMYVVRFTECNDER